MLRKMLRMMLFCCGSVDDDDDDYIVEYEDYDSRLVSFILWCPFILGAAGTGILLVGGLPVAVIFFWRVKMLRNRFPCGSDDDDDEYEYEDYNDNYIYD